MLTENKMQEAGSQDPGRSESGPDSRRLFYTKRQAAKKLGMSDSVFKRRQRLGMYPPTKVDKNGWQWFSEEDVRRFKGETYKGQLPPASRNARASDHEQTSYSDKECTDVFRALNEGKNPADIVAGLGVHAMKVKAIYAIWTELRELVALSGEEVRAIEKLAVDGVWPVKTGEQLVKNLTDMASKRRCGSCGKRSAQVCRACARPKTPTITVHSPQSTVHSPDEKKQKRPASSFVLEQIAAELEEDDGEDRDVSEPEPQPVASSAAGVPPEVAPAKRRRRDQSVAAP